MGGNKLALPGACLSWRNNFLLPSTGSELGRLPTSLRCGWCQLPGSCLLPTPACVEWLPPVSALHPGLRKALSCMLDMQKEFSPTKLNLQVYPLAFFCITALLRILCSWKPWITFSNCPNFPLLNVCPVRGGEPLLTRGCWMFMTSFTRRMKLSTKKLIC